jgi:excisionase family DNA binding protein
MSILLPDVEPLEPTPADADLARELRQALGGGKGGGTLRLTFAADGRERTVEVRPDEVPALAEFLTLVAARQPVAVLPAGRELSTQQAADLLGVSRPYLIGLLERGEIPYRTVGTWRRVRLADLLAYKQKSRARSEAALQELADQAQELGLGY